MKRTGAMGRRLARECALMVLYGMDLSSHRADKALEAFWEDFGREPDLDPRPPWAGDDDERYAGFGLDVEDGPVREYVVQLVRGVDDRRDALDEVIRGISHHWRLERMALVDRNLLRLATYELLHEDVPRKVVINEAIEIAKRFGTAEASAFVNGILDRVRKPE